MELNWMQWKKFAEVLEHLSFNNHVLKINLKYETIYDKICPYHRQNMMLYSKRLLTCIGSYG